MHVLHKCTFWMDAMFHLGASARAQHLEKQALPYIFSSSSITSSNVPTFIDDLNSVQFSYWTVFIQAYK